jgi:hypothetical protein
MSALSALLVAVHILWGIKFSKNMWRLKNGALTGCFHSTQRIIMSVKNVVLQIIIHSCTCKPTFSYVMHVVHWWEQCGPFLAPGAMNWQVAKVNTFFLTVVDLLHSRSFIS